MNPADRCKPATAPRQSYGIDSSSCFESSQWTSDYGIGGVIVLILDIWALINILQSGASNVEKLLWILLIIVLPLIGFIIWLLAGPGGTPRKALTLLPGGLNYQFH